MARRSLGSHAFLETAFTAHCVWQGRQSSAAGRRGKRPTAAEATLIAVQGPALADPAAPTEHAMRVLVISLVPRHRAATSKTSTLSAVSRTSSVNAAAEED
jgi:hypothetical protein